MLDLAEYTKSWMVSACEASRLGRALSGPEVVVVPVWGGRAHLIDVLRRKVFGDGESQLGFGDVLTSFQAVVPLVPLERGHVKLREVHRLYGLRY